MRLAMKVVGGRARIARRSLAPMSPLRKASLLKPHASELVHRLRVLVQVVHFAGGGATTCRARACGERSAAIVVSPARAVWCTSSRLPRRRLLWVSQCDTFRDFSALSRARSGCAGDAARWLSRSFARLACSSIAIAFCRAGREAEPRICLYTYRDILSRSIPMCSRLFFLGRREAGSRAESSAANTNRGAASKLRFVAVFQGALIVRPHFDMKILKSGPAS